MRRLMDVIAISVILINPLLVALLSSIVAYSDMCVGNYVRGSFAALGAILAACGWLWLIVPGGLQYSAEKSMR